MAVLFIILSKNVLGTLIELSCFWRILYHYVIVHPLNFGSLPTKPHDDGRDKNLDADILHSK